VSTSFEVCSSEGNYLVSIRAGVFSEVLATQDGSVVLADSRFASLLDGIGSEAILLNAAESSKELQVVPDIIVSLRKKGANRQTKLVAVGGGVIQDVACFTASIYMRGIEWTYVPTTLLAMVDSCIGGKSSINVSSYKNLVGTFHPPKEIIIDPTVADSLPVEAKIGGLLEACKICFCRGEQEFQRYLDLRVSSQLDSATSEKVIAAALTAKKWFIEVDEFDRGERLLLNFGHTFGHALEAASRFRLSHGIAVGVGMLCALELGRLMKRRNPPDSRAGLLEGHVRDLLSEVPGLADEISKLSVENAIRYFEADKKHGSQHYSIIVVAESGTVELARFTRDASSLGLVEAAMTGVFQSLGSPTLPKVAHDR
jgi:3-dehydroquinate synthase